MNILPIIALASISGFVFSDALVVKEIDPSVLTALAVHTPPVPYSDIETIAFDSCWHDAKTSNKTIERIVRQSPNLFLWLGDNTYADTTNMDVMRNKYDAKKVPNPTNTYFKRKYP